jgi:hypothetical protein
MNPFGGRLAIVLVALSLLACSKPKPGACEVTYDGVTSGDACTMASETTCADGMDPPVGQLSTNKKKAFTAGKTCEEIGYVKSACSDIPLAWSFKAKCPR